MLAVPLAALIAYGIYCDVRARRRGRLQRNPTTMARDVRNIRRDGRARRQMAQGGGSGTDTSWRHRGR